MCVCYALASGTEAIEKEFQAVFQHQHNRCYNARVGNHMPVIKSGHQEEIVSFRWGLLPYWSKTQDMRYRHINANAGDIVKHPVYRVPLRQRRCLVLANCYFEWIIDKGGRKMPFLIYFGGERLFSMAGLWDVWTDVSRQICIETFSIITTHACKRLKPFVPRMPVLIPAGRRRKYLKPSTSLQEVTSMLRPYESDRVNLYPVGPGINDIHAIGKDLLLPIGNRIYKEYEYIPRVYLKLEGMGSRKGTPDHKPDIKRML